MTPVYWNILGTVDGRKSAKLLNHCTTQIGDGVNDRPEVWLIEAWDWRLEWWLDETNYDLEKNLVDI